MKRVIKWRLKSVILSLICLGFWAAIFLPAPGLALTSEFGIADMTWNYSTFMYTDAAGALVPVNWLDPTGVDTRNSFGSAWIRLNGVETDPGDSGFVEGAWALAGLSNGLSDAFSTVGGSGLTQPTGGITRGAILATSDISLNSFGSADVFIAQAAFAGQFTVPSFGTLSISAPYLLQLTLNSGTGNGGFSAGDVSVGLVLSDFDITDPNTGQSFILASDIRSYSNSIIGVGSSTYTESSVGSGVLPANMPDLAILNFALSPGITYDFEAFASTTASAVATPEPTTLFLLGSGLIGLATTLRKRFKKSLR